MSDKRSMRTAYSKWNHGTIRLATLGLSALCVLVTLLSPSPVGAGSVFMKNGYIIHGPIVDRVGTAVVLGWDNGKMTIESRFVDSVVYDPGEEERLQELETLRDEERLALERAAEAASATSFPDELPPDLGDLVDSIPSLDRRLIGDGGGDESDPGSGDVLGPDPIPDGGNVDGTDGQDGAVVTVPDGTDGTDVTDGMDGGMDPGTDIGPVQIPDDPGTDSGDTTGQVQTVTNFDELLGERLFSDQGTFSLRPPLTWTPSEDQDAFQLRAAEGSPRASFNVVRLSRKGLAWEECVDLMKNQQTAALGEFQVLSEGRRELASGEEGFEVIGRGTFQGHVMVVRQFLVPGGETDVWLISGFTADDDDDEAFALIDASLKTFELTNEE